VSSSSSSTNVVEWRSEEKEGEVETWNEIGSAKDELNP
jgi:hypothetical protein